MRGARLDGGESGGYRKSVVVMAMYADTHFGEALDYSCGYLLNVVGKRSAVGVAEREDLRTAANGGSKRLYGIFRVVTVTVEKVLRVKYNGFVVFCSISYGLFYYT